MKSALLLALGIQIILLSNSKVNLTHRRINSESTMQNMLLNNDKRIKVIYANKTYKTDGKVFYMPNKIFDENLSPYEFMIYCFLVSVGDSKGVSY